MILLFKTKGGDLVKFPWMHDAGCRGVKELDSYRQFYQKWCILNLENIF